MGQRHTSKAKVHPASVLTERTVLSVRPTKQYLPDGRTIVRHPVPPGGPPGSVVVIYPDGSYVVGVFDPRTYEANGYCEYRDIANRLIYTGFMTDTNYNGWGSVWDDSGLWPEYTTYWCMNRPGNRILHTTPDVIEWKTDTGWDDEEKEGDKSPIEPLLSLRARRMFDNVRLGFSKHISGSTEGVYHEMVTLYTDIRGNPRQAPPSPNIGKKPINIFHERTGAPAFHPLTPPRSPVFVKEGKIETSTPGVTSCKNPLRFRIPPPLPPNTS